MLNFLLAVSGIVLSATAVIRTTGGLRRQALVVAAELLVSSPGSIPKRSGDAPDPVASCVLGAVAVSAGVIPTAAGLGALSGPLLLPADAVTGIVVALVMLTVGSAAGAWFQYVWVRGAHAASGLGATEVRQRLHRRNPLLISAP